ncbi:MAG: type II toxin-antitoxin system HicB family antitoxin [bacterium]|nr:type II toxin-antitoxin system HicB family antitoxin [bacterium]
MVFTRRAIGDSGLDADRIERWATEALKEAEVKSLDEEGYFVSVAAAPGAWACKPTVDEAMNVLQEVLVDWATLKLADGEDDIPALGGVSVAI